MSESTTSRAAGNGSGNAEAPTTENLAHKAHETIDRFARNSAEAEHKVREQAEAAARKARETEERARAAADRSAERVNAYIKENPIMSAGIAFVAGVFISSLLRR